MATKNTKQADAPVAGLISLGYEAPDYSCGPSTGKSDSKRKTHTAFPTFEVCEEAAIELRKALTEAKLLDGDFAAIVVLRNNMIRVADNDEDENEAEDARLEFTIKALLPHVEGGTGETEESILSDLDKLPDNVKDSGDEDGEENE